MDSYENDPSRLYGSAQVKENKNPQALHRYSSLKYGKLFVSSSVMDPDPDWILIQWGSWIRVQIRNPDPDPRGQK